MTAWYVAAVLGGTLLLLLVARLRAELVALLVLIALEIPGIVTREEALSGFSNSAVITIIGLFVVSAALEQTGVADRIGSTLQRVGGTSERRLIPLVMLLAALLSLVMNNIAAGAVLLPATISVARRVRVSPSKLLLPLAFGASLGGMATIFTTANILISNSLVAANFAPLHFLDFFPFGSVLIVGGILYMVLIGRRLLPSGHASPDGATASNLAQVYNLQDRLWEVRIPASSPLASQTLAASHLGDTLGLTVVGIFHGQSAQLMPGPTTRLHADDVLLVTGREEQVRCMPGVTIGRDGRAGRYFDNPKVQMAEVVVAPRATMLGKTLKELEFRRRYDVTIVAIWHNAQAIRTHIGDIPLQAGDALLVIGPPDRITQMRANPSLIVTSPTGRERPAFRTSRQPIAVAITLLVIGLSISQRLPTSIAVLLGMAMVVLTRCLTMDEALASIEWKTVFVIAGLLPLTTAMQKTGLATNIGAILIHFTGGYGFHVLAGVLYLGTVALTQILGGQVTALVMAPIGIAAAAAAHFSPRGIGVVIAVACSSAFLTPFAHPVNLLMMGPGGYTIRDYLRVGAGMVVVCFVLVIGATFLLPGG
ncbi:MAG: SLC13 family permease [Herpetosiphon sp.]